MTEDVPYRAFTQWSVAQLGVGATEPTEFDTEEAVIAAGSELNLAMLRLADQMDGTTLESVASTFPGIPHVRAANPPAQPGAAGGAGLAPPRLGCGAACEAAASPPGAAEHAAGAHRDGGCAVAAGVFGPVCHAGDG